MKKERDTQRKRMSKFVQPASSIILPADLKEKVEEGRTLLPPSERSRRRRNNVSRGDNKKEG